MAMRRPTIIMVMAILNIVFGGLALILYLCQGAGMVAMKFVKLPNPAGGKGDLYGDMMRSLDKELPNWMAISVASLGGHLILTMLLIVAGLGLLAMKPWGKVLSILVALGLSVMLPLDTYYTITYVTPIQMRWQQEMLKNQPAGIPTFQMSETITNVLTAIQPVLLVLYSLTLIIVMLLPKTGAALRGKSLPDIATVEEYYDPELDSRESSPPELK